MYTQLLLMFPDNSFGLLHLNIHSGNVWYQYKTLGLRTNTSRESTSYFPSSSYSWYSSVKRVQVVVAISQPSAFATISERCVQHYDYSPVPSTCGVLKTKLQRRYGFEWGRGSTALPTSHRMRRSTPVHLFSAVRGARCRRWGALRSLYRRHLSGFHLLVGALIMKLITHLETNNVQFNWPNIYIQHLKYMSYHETHIICALVLFSAMSDLKPLIGQKLNRNLCDWL